MMPFRMLGEQLEVHPRLVVVALEKRSRGELEEVAISDFGLGEQVHMEAAVGAAYRPVESGALGEVRLHADNGLDAGGLGFLDEVDDSVQNPMVGDGNRRLPIGRRCRHHVLDPGRTIEHRILGVDVEVCE